MKLYSVFTGLLLSVSLFGQTTLSFDSLLTQSLSQGKSYEYLRQLCKDIGPRLSGSENAAKAVQWGKEVLTEVGVDRVYLQPVMVPHWERGEEENAFVIGSEKPLKTKALGGTVGTDGKAISGKLVEVTSFTQLEELGKKGVLKGAVVLFNQPMNAALRNTFMAYSGAVSQRSEGAWRAAQHGAVGVLVRSLTLAKDAYPHTGGMRYKDGVKKIPALAVSTEDADWLSKQLANGEKLSVGMELTAKWFEDAPSHNVIAEWKGTENPDEIITIGGHLDSWDVGEGAHDDGAGIVHSIEALRLLVESGYMPKNTLRVVLFMNEENGVRGGEKYAAEAKTNNEKHVGAIESDRGGFAPVGFSIQASDERVAQFKKYEKQLAVFGISEVFKGYGGVDIGKLAEPFPNIVLSGLVPESQRYFNYHHADTDVLEAVDERELKIGAAAMAAMLYIFDQEL